MSPRTGQVRSARSMSGSAHRVELESPRCFVVSGGCCLPTDARVVLELGHGWGHGAVVRQNLELVIPIGRPAGRGYRRWFDGPADVAERRKGSEPNGTKISYSFFRFFALLIDSTLLFRVAVFEHLSPCFFSWLGHQRVRFGASFQRSRLDAPGSQPDTRFADEKEYSMDGGTVLA